MDFDFASPKEIVAEIGARLKRARQLTGMSQGDLALRAGTTERAVRALEKDGNGSIETMCRLAYVLQLGDDLNALFAVKPTTSISDTERQEREQTVPKQAPRRVKFGVAKGRFVVPESFDSSMELIYSKPRRQR